MRPIELTTKIFLDSGNPQETKEILNLLGFLDGQTTNPSLISQNQRVSELIESGKKITKQEANSIYKEIIEEIVEIIPQGDISIEVYSDESTTKDEMLADANEMVQWTKNARIKLPLSKEGLKAAKQLVKTKVKINMTLCFTQEQAAATYSIVKDADESPDVFISPFIGRLDDINRDGTDLVLNIMRMFAFNEKHVKVLAASVRDLPHFLYCLYLKPDYITAPYSVLKEWAESGLKVPGLNFDESVFADKSNYFESLHEDNLKGISYQEIDLDLKWTDFDIKHELTDAGIKKFADDWHKFVE